jgi:membrane protein
MVYLLKKVAPLLLFLKHAFTSLQANDPIRMAGATAFFAFFAIPPIVIILSSVLSQLFNTRYQRISGQLFDEFADLFGPKSANQLEDISQRLQLPKPDLPLTVLSFFLLLLASTTLFSIIKNSLNQLWNVKPKPGRHLLHILTDKLIALAIILGSGLLFSSSLLMEQKRFSDYFCPQMNKTCPVVQLRTKIICIIKLKLLTINNNSNWHELWIRYSNSVNNEPLNTIRSCYH